MEQSKWDKVNLFMDMVILKHDPTKKRKGLVGQSTCSYALGKMVGHTGTRKGLQSGR